MGAGGLQIADVAGVKDVEDAVREDDLLSGPSQIGGQSGDDVPLREDRHPSNMAPPLNRQAWRGR